LDKSKHLGDVDMGTVKEEQKEHDPDEDARQDRIARMPILEQCYNLMDFESVAKQVMKKSAWAYYSSGADDEIVSRHILRNMNRIANCSSDNARKPFSIP
jgi:L-lactate dehydrogenase (cytochrome)